MPGQCADHCAWKLRRCLGGAANLGADSVRRSARRYWSVRRCTALSKMSTICAGALALFVCEHSNDAQRACAVFASLTRAEHQSTAIRSAVIVVSRACEIIHLSADDNDNVAELASFMAADLFVSFSDISPLCVQESVSLGEIPLCEGFGLTTRCRCILVVSCITFSSHSHHSSLLNLNAV